VWASLTRELKDVITEAFDEAEGRTAEHRKRWLVLVDDDLKLKHWVRAETRRGGVEITTLVLDFIHALEYPWKAAHVFFDDGAPRSRPGSSSGSSACSMVTSAAWWRA
jgi:hypothetical protein